MYIPPSNNNYNQNYYGYGPNSSYGPPGYGPNRPPYYADQGRNYNNYNNYNNNYNNNYRNIQSFQPLLLDQALEQSSYPSYNREFIKNYIINDYYENGDAKVYLQSIENEKTFVIEYTLSVIFSRKPYKIILYVHIPVLFPNYPPEFYVQKKPNTGLNKSYLNGKIDDKDFKINIDKFLKYDANLNNVQTIIDNIKNEFNKEFPIYRDQKPNQREIFGKNNIDKNKVNEIIIKPDSFTDKQFLNFMRKQVKDILRSKFYDFNTKYKVEQNHKELKTMNDISKMKVGKSDTNNPMNQELEKLKTIQKQLNEIENNLQNQCQQIQNENKSAFEKCEELIKIKDEKDMEYAVMKKTIEDYLVYLRKAYEKRIISFHDMVEQTRLLSREIFSIDYLRKQRKSYY